MPVPATTAVLAITTAVLVPTMADGVTRITAIHPGRTRPMGITRIHITGVIPIHTMGGYSNAYSYYQPGYGYDTATVAAVQRRLGELGYYHGVVDGVMGPQTRAAITAFESTHGMIVDGMITTRLLNRMGV